MKLLKKYYEEKITVEGMPRFEDLTESNKRQLKETVGFAFYKVNDAVRAFGEACKPFMGKNGLLKD